jgi:DNA-binding XRE family transcriptional regulator
VAEQPNAFGIELRRLREAAGLSLADLARRVHYSKGYLSKIETGGQRPNIVLARQCDAALSANGALAGLVPHGRTPSDTMTHESTSDSEVWPMSLDPASSQFGPTTSASGLNVGMVPPLGFGIPPQALSTAAHDEATVAAFRSLLGQSVRLGELVSGRVVLPMVIAHTHTLRCLAAEAPASTRPSLWLLAALNASYAGWLALEAGDDHAAQWWSNKAVRMASHAGNADLVAYALIRQAQIAVYRNDATQTIALAHQAQQNPHVSRHFLGVAAHREAQGHALAGNYNECRRALDRSTILLLDVADGPPTIAGALLPPMAGGGSHVGGVIAGWCLHELGHTAEATAILDQEVVRIDKTHRRATARFGARRVLAYAASGEVDHACSLTHQLLDVAELVDSATTRLELRQLARTLRRWHTYQPVRELQARLSTALRDPTSMPAVTNHASTT